MLVISRFRYADDAAGLADDAAGLADDAAGPADGAAGLADRARVELGACLTELGRQTGFVTGVVGRAMDDPTLWVLQTSWRDVGSYRRALSSYEIKASVVPVLSYAVDEPSAYEVIVGEGATEPNQSRPRST
jgi:hypothetical protein